MVLPKLFYGWSRNPKKKPWSWLLMRWCTWGVSKENYGLIKSGFWDTCKLDFAPFHLPYLHYYYTPNACFPDFSFSAILTLLLHPNACFPDFSFSAIVLLMPRRVPKAVPKYWKLKCVSIGGAISWGLFRPLPMKEIELWSNPIWDSGPRLEIILEFWPKDWSTFGLGLEPFSSTVQGFCIWNLWSS